MEAFAALHTVVPVNPVIAWTAAAYTFAHTKTLVTGIFWRPPKV